MDMEQKVKRIERMIKRLAVGSLIGFLVLIIIGLFQLLRLASVHVAV